MGCFVNQSEIEYAKLFYIWMLNEVQVYIYQQGIKISTMSRLTYQMCDAFFKVCNVYHINQFIHCERHNFTSMSPLFQCGRHNFFATNLCLFHKVSSEVEPKPQMSAVNELILSLLNIKVMRVFALPFLQNGAVSISIKMYLLVI